MQGRPPVRDLALLALESEEQTQVTSMAPDRPADAHAPHCCKGRAVRSRILFYFSGCVKH